MVCCDSHTLTLGLLRVVPFFLYQVFPGQEMGRHTQKPNNEGLQIHLRRRRFLIGVVDRVVEKGEKIKAIKDPKKKMRRSRPLKTQRKRGTPEPER